MIMLKKPKAEYTQTVIDRGAPDPDPESGESGSDPDLAGSNVSGSGMDLDPTG